MKDYTPLLTTLETQLAAKDKKPLYQRFALVIKAAVRNGMLQHDDILPSEREFSQLLPISRITVRKALEALENEGVVYRSRGYGTQIRSPLEYSLKESKGLSQHVVLNGKTPSTRWINKSRVVCNDEIAHLLALPSGSHVFLLKRIRYVDEQAVSVEESYVPEALIDNPDQIGVSLYDYFRAHDIQPGRAQSRVSARMPDTEIQQQIALADNLPVLVIKQRLLDVEGNPIEYSISYCRSDMYVFIAG